MNPPIISYPDNGNRLLEPFQLYNNKAAREDRIFVTDCNESIDTMLVFAGLFSAVITTLVVQTSAMLQADPQDRVTELLAVLINATAGHPSSIPPPNPFTPKAKVVVINALFFLSLILSLGAALGAMLVKQWARRYHLQGVSTGITWQVARNRYQRHEGLLKWHLAELILWIPMLLHIALAIFLVGVILWLQLLHRALFITATVVIALGASLYFIFALVPIFDSNAPFHWPMSSCLLWSINILQSVSRWLKGRLKSSLHTHTSGRKISSHQSSDIEVGSVASSSQYMLTPKMDFDPFISLPNTHRFQEADALILIEILRQTEVNEEIESTLDQIRSAQWNDTDISKILSENGDLILHRCNGLATSTWHLIGLSPNVKGGMLDRVRSTCRFIEWFYYRLPTRERLRLTTWPDNKVALALRTYARDELGQLPKLPSTLPISTTLEDMVLAESVIAKLNHVSLRENQYCGICFLPTERSRSDIRWELVRVHHPEHPAEPRIHSALFQQELISACVLSDADCLMNYIDPSQYKELVDQSIKIYERTVPPSHTILKKNYESLVMKLERWEKLLDDSDDRKIWFSKLLGYAQEE